MYNIYVYIIYTYNKINMYNYVYIYIHKVQCERNLCIKVMKAKGNIAKELQN